MDEPVNIVGIAGLPRSGKDTLAELFIKEGHYYGVSLGDIVRNISRVRHKEEVDPISVANMTETSNWLRSTHGPDFALKQALSMYREADDTYKGLVVWSVRAPVEADFILKYHGELIWVETDDLIRYQRAIEFLREGEQKISLEEFKAQEDLQWKPRPGLPESVQMNISYVKSHATRQLVNNTKDLGQFREAADKLINDLEAKKADAS